MLYSLIISIAGDRLSISGDRRSGDVRERYIRETTTFGPDRKADRPVEAKLTTKTCHAGSRMVGSMHRPIII
jgi:hypothetical protein